MSNYADLGGFEYAGVRFSRWETEHGTRKVTVQSGRTVYPMNRDTAVAIHAFIEAERDEWRWTNDEHTEARRGRWVADVDSIRHEETGQTWGRESRLMPDAVRAAMDSFISWWAVQHVPAEPTGLGAVVEAGGMLFVYAPDCHGDSHPWTTRDDEGRGNGLYSWGGVAKRGPVTILSPGVDA